MANFEIFKNFFGIFRNFQKNVWNFLLPTNHRYRTTARSAPVDTASTPQLQLLQGSKQRQKVPGSQLQVLRSIKIQNQIFSARLRFQDFRHQNHITSRQHHNNILKVFFETVYIFFLQILGVEATWKLTRGGHFAYFSAYACSY